jgi:hypothetical protein
VESSHDNLTKRREPGVKKTSSMFTSNSKRVLFKNLDKRVPPPGYYSSEKDTIKDHMMKNL